jgi:undecaprenyl pyrophosphate phosphatase UppP
MAARRRRLKRGRGGAVRAIVRARFWLEAGLACLCAVLAVVTVFWRDWIEAITGFDPDHHNGSFEWLIVASLFAACLLVGLAARAEWRRSMLLTEH